MLSLASSITLLVWLLSLVQARPQPVSLPYDGATLFKRGYGCFDTGTIGTLESNAIQADITRAVNGRLQARFPLNNLVSVDIDARLLSSTHLQINVAITNTGNTGGVLVTTRRRSALLRNNIEEIDRTAVFPRNGAIAYSDSWCINIRGLSGRWFIQFEEDGS